MRLYRTRILALAVAVGCGGSSFAASGSNTVAGDTELSNCLTEELIGLVGQDEVAARAVVPELARIIPPNSAVTQDFRPDRVNVDLDEKGIVTRVWCG